MPSEPAVEVDSLRKEYVVNERAAGLMSALRSLVKRQQKIITAVDRISFKLTPGEIVGFLGPNGAGKTTTLKMLSGLVHPTGGDVHVLGYQPFKRQRDFLRQIALIMGNRNQLVWDIPAIDSFELNRAIYRIPPDEYQRTLAELIELLELQPLLNRPVRNLSLGERMKCEVAAALLHRPKVLFLDEPTIGLDVTMQRRIRSFIGEYNRRFGATVLLTSHYMADVEALCKRVIVIHHGKLLYDGELGGLVQRFSPHKTIRVELAQPSDVNFSSYGKVIASEHGVVTLRVPKSETAAMTAKLLANLPVIDLTVEDPPIEEVIEQVFANA